MASYRIEWKGSAGRDLRGIDRRYIPGIVEAIDTLAVNPFPIQTRKLQGVESSYRLRVGDYRVIYQVDSVKKTIVIFHVRHRKEAYRNIE